MWQRFTEGARNVILQGQEEAIRRNSGVVGTEHLLLGLLRESNGVGARVLQTMNLNLDIVRERMVAEMWPQAELNAGEPKLTSAAKRALELAADEARRMSHNYIGTEHLLLAFTRQQDELAAKVLGKLGANLEEARVQVARYLAEEPELAALTSPERKRRRTSPEFLEVLEAAAKIRHEAGHEGIEVKDLLIAICEGRSAHLLSDAGVDVDALLNHLRA